MKFKMLVLLLFCAVLWSPAFSGSAVAAEGAAMPGGAMMGDHKMGGSMPGGGMMGDHKAGGMMVGGQGLSEMNQEYMRAMAAMHEPMMRGVMDPDPDAAFVRGMLPHHEGAVDMANIQLKYGKDPELRKMAQDIIDAQEKEIRFMEEWLKKQGKTQ